MEPSPDCADRRVLREQYRGALRAYIAATEALDALEFGSQFDEAYRHASLARMALEQVRQEYNRHIAEHACA